MLDGTNMGIQDYEAITQATSAGVSVPLQWYAVRMRRNTNSSVSTTLVEAQYESYKKRGGKIGRRLIKETGKKVYVPEYILRKMGFDVFLPIKKVQRIKNRYTREKHWVTTPKLTDWIFVGWPVDQCRWHQLMSLNQVTSVLGMGGMPLQISETKIMRMMKIWGGKNMAVENYKYLRRGADYDVGSSVRIVDGPFDGQDISITQTDARSVRGLVQMFGKDFEIDLDVGSLAEMEKG